MEHTFKEIQEDISVFIKNLEELKKNEQKPNSVKPVHINQVLISKIDISIKIFQIIFENQTSIDLFGTNFIIIKYKFGSQLIKLIKSEKISSNDVDKLMVTLIFLVREVYLSVSENEKAIIASIHSEILTQLQLMTSENRDYFSNVLPVLVIEKKLADYRIIVNQEENKIKDNREEFLHKVNSHKGILDETLKNVVDKISEADKATSIVNEKVEYLDNISQKLNFGILSKQINDLAIEKLKEKSKQIIWLVVFGIFMIIPIASVILLEWFSSYFLGSNHINSNTDYLILVIKLIPFATLEIIFIYFFRIILQIYMSIKRQLLQLNYRSTVAQFTNEYVKFIKEQELMEKSDNLTRFEQLIYGELSFDDKNIPTPYDGVNLVLQPKK